MAEPLTKEERRRLVAAAERWNVLGPNKRVEVLAGDVATTLLRYDATVKECEERIDALDAELARLRPLAEIGESSNSMPVGFGLSHAADNLWLVWDSRGGEDVDETCGPTPLVALNKLAELLAGKDEAS